MFRDEKTRDFLKMFTQSFPNGKVASIAVRNIPNQERSHTAEFISDQLKANLYSIKGDPEVCQKELIGYFELDEEGKPITWEEGIVPRAIKDANEEGTVVLEVIDLHNITPECQLHINPLLSSDPCVQIVSKAFEKVCLNDNARLFFVAENTGYPSSGMQEAIEDKMSIHLDMDNY